MSQLISRLAVAIAVASGILVGCGDPAGAAAPEHGAAPAAQVQDVPVATDTVAIKNFAFSPATVTIKTGTTLTWTNQDQEPHDVSATAGPFHSPTLSPGQSYRYTFTAPGRFEYLCTIHPFMTATVVVTP